MDDCENISLCADLLNTTPIKTQCIEEVLFTDANYAAVADNTDVHIFKFFVKISRSVSGVQCIGKPAIPIYGATQVFGKISVVSKSEINILDPFDFVIFDHCATRAAIHGAVFTNTCGYILIDRHIVEGEFVAANIEFMGGRDDH